LVEVELVEQHSFSNEKEKGIEREMAIRRLSREASPYDFLVL